MAVRSGPTGSVHSFEPVPTTFEELRKNVGLCSQKNSITLNNKALGDLSGEIEINLYDSMPTGHASLAGYNGRASKHFRVDITTLDEYLAGPQVSSVDFVKVDIEGAELMFLTGAESIFRQERPPVILMEMALEQARRFGYEPNELISFIRSRGEYVFYRVDEEAGKMFEFKAFSSGDVGANVFCIPQSRNLNQTIESFIG
jgi:FkbM family methyltransferase